MHSLITISNTDELNPNYSWLFYENNLLVKLAVTLIPCEPHQLT